MLSLPLTADRVDSGRSRADIPWEWVWHFWATTIALLSHLILTEIDPQQTRNNQQVDQWLLEPTTRRREANTDSATQIHMYFDSHREGQMGWDWQNIFLHDPTRGRNIGRADPAANDRRRRRSVDGALRGFLQGHDKGRLGGGAAPPSHGRRRAAAHNRCRTMRERLARVQEPLKAQHSLY